MTKTSTRLAHASRPPQHTRSTEAIASAFIASLESSRVAETPYRHWLLTQALPDDVARAIADLPWAPPPIGDTHGARETHNATRTHFTVEQRRHHAICDEVARTFQDPEVVAAIERRCGVDLSGTSLRIEYCQDTRGFWLGPHTDIGVKKFTMQI